MWMRAELFVVEDGEPVAAVTLGHVDPERLAAAVQPIVDGFAVQLRRRALEARLARLMPELAAALFDPAKVPSRKSEALLAWHDAGPECLMVMVRGEFAGRWHDLRTGQSGGPLDLIRACQDDTLSGPGTAEDFAEAWLADREPAQGSLGGAGGVPPSPQPSPAREEGESGDAAA